MEIRLNIYFCCCCCVTYRTIEKCTQVQTKCLFRQTVENLHISSHFKKIKWKKSKTHPQITTPRYNIFVAKEDICINSVIKYFSCAHAHWNVIIMLLFCLKRNAILCNFSYETLPIVKFQRNLCQPPQVKMFNAIDFSFSTLFFILSIYLLEFSWNCYL